MSTRTAIVMAICLCLGGFAVGASGSLSIAAEAGAPIDPSPSSASDVEIDSALADADGSTTVIVRLTERSDAAVAATASEKQVASMRSHAAVTRTPFERFADGNPHVEIERQFWITNALVVTVDADRVPLERLGRIENVTGVHENADVEVAGAATPPAGAAPSVRPTAAAATYDTTYGLERINATATWDGFDTRGEGVKVAVLDTGYDPAYEDDIGLYTRDESDPTYPGGWAEFASDGTRVPDSTPRDTGSHGTHVSGTVAGGDASGEYIGVAPETDLMHGLVLPNGGGTTAQIIAGIQWAVAEDADVVSMSLGIPCDDGEPVSVPQFVDPIRNAEASGTTVVAASGNDGAGCTGSPGDVYDALTVGATDETDDVPSFSGSRTVDTSATWGSDAPAEWPDTYDKPDVVAPGVGVKSAYPAGDTYAYADGTSMATPHVAGAIALLQASTAADLEPDEIRALLTDAAVTVDADAARQGAGRTDVFEARLEHERRQLEPTITPARANVSADATIALEAEPTYEIEAYRWTVDGEHVGTTAEPAVTHTFDERADAVPVSVELVDAGRNHRVETSEIDVVDELPPTAAFDAPADPIANATVTFDATAATDNHEIDRYEWTFGADADPVETTDPTITHEFAAPGDREVTLTVVDSAGNTDATTELVSVRSPPVVTIDEPADGAATAADPVPLAYTLANTDRANAAGLEYRVTDAAGEPVVDWTDGPFEATADPWTADATLSDVTDGTRTIELRLVDDAGAPLPFDAATADRTITVDRAPPALSADARPAGENTTHVGPRNPAVVTVSTSDPRHESTTVTIASAADGADPALEWDLTDDTGSGETVTREWSAVDASGATVESGRYELTVSTVDALGNENTSSTTIDVDTDAPSVAVADLAGATDRDGDSYLDGDSDLTVVVAADAGAPEAVGSTVDAVAVSLESTATTYRHAATAQRDPDDETRWTATVPAGALPDDGRYRVRATATDAAENANEATATVAYDRTDPRLSAVVDELDGNGTATVRVRSSEPLRDAPTLDVTGPDGAAVAVDPLVADSETETGWTGTLEVDAPGRYRLVASGVDRAGNERADATTATVRSVDADARTVTVPLEGTERDAFVTFEPPADAEPTRTAVSASSTAPRSLPPELGGVTFLTTAFGDDRYGLRSNATVGVPVDRGRLPDGVPADDDRVQLREYAATETGERWTQAQPLTIRELEDDGDDDTERPTDGDRETDSIAGEYWTATLADLAAETGVTVVDDRPPELVAGTPDAGATLENGTETVTVDLEYADDVSGVDVSSIDLFVDGEPVTDPDLDPERVRITSNRTVYAGLPVEDGASYAIELAVADRAGNAARLETTFDVATADDGDGGGGGLSFPSPSLTDDEPDRPGPSAAITVEPNPASIGETVTLSGSESTDEQRRIVRYEWVIDGATETGETVTTAFDEPGTYDIELTVTNDFAESNATTATVTVDADESVANETNESDAARSNETETDTAPNTGSRAVDSVPGFGGFAALVAVSIVLAITGRPRRGRR